MVTQILEPAQKLTSFPALAVKDGLDTKTATWSVEKQPNWSVTVSVNVEVEPKLHTNGLQSVELLNGGPGGDQLQASIPPPPEPEGEHPS